MNAINIISPINKLGYGISGLNIVKTLSSLYDVSLFPIGPIDLDSQEDADIIKQCIMNSYMPDFSAPCIRIWHQHDMAQFVGKGPRIGFPFFELDVFTEHEKHHLNSLDFIFVSSGWAKSICEKELKLNPENILVVPLGVNTDIFQKSESSKNKNTVFFNCGKWEVRKGHDVIPQMFNKAFTPEDDVELWMMCENPFLTENEQLKWQDVYKQTKLGDKIKFIPRVNTSQEVYNIMSQIDCGIFPSRAEGWNLELLEVLACGKKVITTNNSAHTEYCNKDNSILIDTPELEIAVDGKFFKGFGQWSSITQKNIDQFSEAMKTIHLKKQSGNLTINEQGVRTAQSFNWNNTSRKIQTHVQFIQKKEQAS